MSLYDYKISKEIAAKDYPFYCLIMAAMRQADSLNIEKLKSVFPDTWEELRERYNSPGGYLKTELEECASVFHKGVQIAYIPDHVNNRDLTHKDVEFGFVMEFNMKGAVLCRFWSKSNPDYLRTVANGEWTPIFNLMLQDSVEQPAVDRLVKLIDDDKLTSENCHA